MNITVVGLTNPDVNLKRMHQLYNAVELFRCVLYLDLNFNKGIESVMNFTV